jgi:hypothetical protein
MQGGILANCSDNWEIIIHDSNDALASPFCYNGGASNRHFEIGRDLGWGTMYTVLRQSARSPIFYDSDDTAFYIDGNGTSVLNSTYIYRTFFRRENGANTGISWYSPSFTSWAEYMSPAGATGCGATGNITAPSGTLVTSWALRSFIENATNYGWTWESGTAYGQPSVVAEIRSSDGSAAFNGSVRTPIYYDSNDTGYYIDAASTSRLVVLQIANNSYQTGPNAYLRLDANTLLFGGNNNGKELNSGQISVGQHQSNSLNFVGMSSGTGSSDRRMDFWVEGGAYFRGSLVCTGNITAYGSTSDKRLKTNIKRIESALEKISSVSGYTFNWNEKAPEDKVGKMEYGVIAQEVESAGLAELVFDYTRPVNKTGGDDTPPEQWKAVHYDKFVPLLIEAIKELKKEIDELKKNK